MSIKEVRTKTELDAIVKGYKHVIVDFTATWCGPCKNMAEVIKKEIKGYKNVMVVKVDVDEMDGGIQSEFNVRTIPTFVRFEGGVKKESFSGAKPEMLVAMMEYSK